MAKKGKVKKGRHHKFPDEGRPEKVRFYQEFYLIVCEDEKTEPEYFKKFKAYFPAQTLFLIAIGTGLSPLGIVNKATELRKVKSSDFDKDIDHVWAVFDVDDHGAGGQVTENFKQAEEAAKAENIALAISNEVFEIWILLHFAMINPSLSLPRSVVYEMINDEVKKHNVDFEYKHGDMGILNQVKKYGDEDLAISRAQELIKHHNGVDVLHSNPITNVVSLVVELKEWIDYFNYKKE
jgi:hypothetical protein